MLGKPARAFRVDQARFKSGWDSAEAAQALGGRWNPKGRKAVYCSLDAATAILEVAVHKGFRALDVVPHVMTALTIADVKSVHVVTPADVPERSWLSAGIPSADQQEFGAVLLDEHVFVAIPSVVSRHSWNLLFDPDRAVGKYSRALQEPLSIDPRLS